MALPKLALSTRVKNWGIGIGALILFASLAWNGFTFDYKDEDKSLSLKSGKVK